jgi:hypothetical protein
MIRSTGEFHDSSLFIHRLRYRKLPHVDLDHFLIANRRRRLHHVFLIRGEL